MFAQLLLPLLAITGWISHQSINTRFRVQWVSWEYFNMLPRMIIIPQAKEDRFYIFHFPIV